jgi:hypothetical protein
MLGFIFEKGKSDSDGLNLIYVFCFVVVIDG